jgi:hypothetical protein
VAALSQSSWLATESQSYTTHVLCCSAMVIHYVNWVKCTLHDIFNLLSHSLIINRDASEYPKEVKVGF